jgi:hypothetical protein
MLPRWRRDSTSAERTEAGTAGAGTHRGGAALVALCAFGIGIIGGITLHALPHHALAYCATATIGAVAGATELIGRYRDKPTAAIATVPGAFYIFINTFVSLTALWLLLSGQLPSFIAERPGTSETMLQTVLLAGFGSMAFFRTSIFNLRVRDTEIAIGPAIVFQILLRSADRACDRGRAGPRAKIVKSLMKGVNFSKAKEQLPLHCLALMQNVSADEGSQINQAIAAIDAAQLSEEVKSYNLGLLLMLCVGEDVLKESVDALRNVIVVPGTDEPPILRRATSLPLADLRIALEFCLALNPFMPEPSAKVRDEVFSFDQTLSGPKEQSIVALLRLRGRFGTDILSRALELLDARTHGADFETKRERPTKDIYS